MLIETVYTKTHTHENYYVRYWRLDTNVTQCHVPAYSWLI
jgi:hypothetical protein